MVLGQLACEAETCPLNLVWKKSQKATTMASQALACPLSDCLSSLSHPVPNSSPCLEHLSHTSMAGFFKRHPMIWGRLRHSLFLKFRLALNS